MELPRRARGDEYAPAGRLAELCRRIAVRPGVADTPVACFYAFDFRTRLLPYLFYDRRMAPAGLRAVAAAFHESGFRKTRAVFQLWSPNVRPSACRIDGEPIQVVTTTAMQIHSRPSFELIADAYRMGADRPLILAGGPKAIYEPDHYFGLGPRGDIHADAVCTGEELVLLELLDRITEHRGPGESMRAAFERCRDRGLLDDIPGLVYRSAECDDRGRPILISTGVQRLVRDMDELPGPLVGFSLLEPPHRRRELARRPLALDQVHKHSSVASLVTTHGCKFACSYCPIPAYNQRTWRTKSPQRLAEEIKVVREQMNIRYFFGTDDNFFNNRKTAEEMLTAIVRTPFKMNGRYRSSRRAVRFATEATEFDLLKNKDLLPLAYEAGTWAIWLGIEDLAADLINKGQTPAKTIELFRLLNSNGILPMAMMMYHVRQPLRSAGSDLRGLLNQARFLFEQGAGSYQCTLHSPAVGTKEYERTFNSGTVIKYVDGERIPDAYYDGNHVLACPDGNPARMHLNMLHAYLAFYNPLHMVREIWRGWRGDRTGYRRAAMHVIGMASLTATTVKSLPWIFREGRGRVGFWSAAPTTKFAIRPAAGAEPGSIRLPKAPAPLAAVS